MVSEEELDEAISRGEISPEEAATYFDAPQGKEKSSLFVFLNKVLKATQDQLSKVTNLHDNEIVSMNELRKGSIYSQVHDLDLVASFFDAECDSYLALCDSRKGFLLTTAITTKKEVGSKTTVGEASPKKKWFGMGKAEE